MREPLGANAQRDVSIAPTVFFHVPEWGVFRNARYVTLSELKKVPVPDLRPQEVEELAVLHQRLIETETQSILAAYAKVQSLQMELLNSNHTRASGHTTIPDLLSKVSSEQRL